MTSILRLTETVLDNEFIGNYLIIKKFFWYFSAVLESRLNIQEFLKKLTLIANLFLKLRTQEEAVR